MSLPPLDCISRCAELLGGLLHPIDSYWSPVQKTDRIDGQVTVWDHRSTHPLAIFHTSAESPHTSHSYPSSATSSTSARSPSFSADLARARMGVGSGVPIGDDGMGMVLVDPGSGEVRPGSSNSGREAARVVKFSPEGSGRDLMVFSEVSPSSCARWPNDMEAAKPNAKRSRGLH